MLIYLLKVNLLLAALYALYRLLLHRDTFFAWRRATLLAIVIVSLLAPLPALQGWTEGVLPGQVAQGITAEAWLPEFIVTPQGAEAAGNDSPLLTYLAMAYAAGALLLVGRMLVQLLAICVITLVITFGVTAWTVTGVIRLMERRKGEERA